MRAAAFASCLALSGSALLPFAGARDVQAVEDTTTGSPRDDQEQHLAVIVPVYRGDLSRAVSSLERWPSTCSPLTEQNADLVLYYAEGEEDAPAVTAALDTIRETAGNCFAETRLVYAHLSQEVRNGELNVEFSLFFISPFQIFAIIFFTLSSLNGYYRRSTIQHALSAPTLCGSCLQFFRENTSAISSLLRLASICF